MSEYSILIVDDDAGIRNLLVKLLTREGYQPRAACSGREALQLLQEDVYDLLLSDIRMPEMDGLSLLDQVRQRDPHLPIILMTAFATVESAITALRAGVQDYIMKPFDNREVLSAIKKNLNAADVPANAALPPGKLRGYVATQDERMLQTIRLIEKVAASTASVLLYGETGTGKELAARGIHDGSSRANKPFIKINCAALPENLLEAELFGYERGAYTGAISSKPGRFEIANGGTILLDEIGELPLPLQSKLLRFLQEKTFERLGGIKSFNVDVRIIAATNRNLEEMVQLGAFRQDLFYRLNVITIELPPLRERAADILPLAHEFLCTLQEEPRRVKQISPTAVQALQSYDWPGNIRELRNVIERGIIIAQSSTLEDWDLPEKLGSRENSSVTTNLGSAVDTAEREAILNALHQTEGNRSLAAQLLGISRRSLHRKLARYDL